MEAPHMSLAEYLESEASAQTKHEYWEGHIVALAGASPEHNRITTNLVTELNIQLRSRGCYVAAADQRVRVSETQYTYPDISVSCHAEFDRQINPPSLVNPDLLVEVTSDTTAEIDRGSKVDAYLRIKGLKEYWVVSQHEPLVMQCVPQDGYWEVHPVRGLAATICSEPLGLQINLSDIYALVL